MTWRLQLFPEGCANAECPNGPDSGRFLTLRSTEALVGGHRKITLHMCAPCALQAALEEV